MSWDDCTGRLSDAEFRVAYRLNRQEFDDLLARILETTPTFQRQRSTGIDARLRLASCLRYLAGASWIDCARLHGQAKSTFFLQFHETVNAIIATAEARTDWKNKDQLINLERMCSRPGAGNGAFRGAVGFVDGIVFRTRRPAPGEVPNVRDMYCGRKRYWGIGVQAVCTAQLKFTVFAVTSGTNSHDSSAFAATEVGRLFSTSENEGGVPDPYYLVGDAAYAGNRRVITPFTRRSYSRGTDEDTFNFIHSSKRMAIERAFGVLVRRWGIVWRKLEFTVRKNIKVLYALVVLHNICTLRRDHGEDVRLAHPDDSGRQPRDYQSVVEMFCYPPNSSSGRSTSSDERTRMIIAQALMDAGCFRP